MSKLQKWQLINSEDVSPSPHFPLEKRQYKLPDGRIVNDFFVTTLADSVHIVPVTTDGKIVLIRMYKQGEDAIVTQFPAGRFEKSKHNNEREAAVWELHEETGIEMKPEELIFVYEQAVMTTKSSEHTHLFLAKNVSVNSQQKLDENEEIEVLIVTPKEVDQLIESGEINEGLIIADWYLVNKKFPELFQR